MVVIVNIEIKVQVAQQIGDNRYHFRDGIVVEDAVAGDICSNLFRVV